MSKYVKSNKKIKWNYEDKNAITALENMKKGIPMNVVYDDDGNYWDVFLKSISVL
jgi:hypothetical protein